MQKIINTIKSKLNNMFKPITNLLPVTQVTTPADSNSTSYRDNINRNNVNPLESQTTRDKALLYVLQISNNTILNTLENDCKVLFDQEKTKSLQLPDNSPEQRHALENVHILAQNLKIIAEQKQSIVSYDTEFKEYIKRQLSLRNITPYTKKNKSK